MASETDPLLPHNDPAPEISGLAHTKPNPSTEGSLDRSDPPSYLTHGGKESSQDGGEGKEAPGSTDTSFAKRAVPNICTIFVVVVLFGFLASIVTPGRLIFHRGDRQPSPEPVPGRPSHDITQRVEKILEQVPLFDGHDDLAIFIRFIYKNDILAPDFRKRFEQGGMEMHVDLPRLKKGRVGGTFWSAFVPCPANASYDFSDQVYGEPVSATLSQIDLIRRLQRHYPNTFAPATSTPAEALSLFHQNQSLISPISIEGLHQVPQTSPFSTLRLYHSLGVRAATLTWNCHNAFADAALVPSNDTGATIPAPPFRGGLTSMGRQIIREMNRLGILIDLSHTSYWTQKAVLTDSTSLAPVIFSHSSAFSLCGHPRNVHDDILELVKATNSVVMINFTPGFISCLPPPNSSVLPDFFPQNNTLHQVARHVVYIGGKIGYDHVGFGSDFDGTAMTPEGLDGVDKFPALVAELLRIGVSDDDAAKIVGRNVLRVWQAAEHVSQQMYEDGVPEMLDEIPDLRG